MLVDARISRTLSFNSIATGHFERCRYPVSPLEPRLAYQGRRNLAFAAQQVASGRGGIICGGGDGMVVEFYQIRTTIVMVMMHC